jgi:AraC family transcriptional regulator, exoenzyme S synthesis regulatory protein ExsA
LFNFYGQILSNPNYYRQLKCKETLITLFNCPLENKYEDAWSHYNYIIFVIEGRKIWHTAHGSYDLQKGSCVFVRKGACIVEQFFDTAFCLVMFFVPDEFICEVLQSKATPIFKHGKRFDPIIPIHSTLNVQGFFQSMMPHFESPVAPDQSLLELKFKELILTISDNPHNHELLSYFFSLLNEPQSVSLQRIMEENFSFNLKLEEFAQLSNRSLSAFKRDFQKQFNTTPGKWLLEKRLNNAMHMLTNMNKTVNEVAFENGFENPSHFSRAFKARFNMPPTAARQQLHA